MRNIEFSDNDWIERVRQGDQSAADALVERLSPTVFRSVCAHLPRRASDKDMAQIVFLKMFKNLDQFSGLVPLEHWVSRIAVNTCLNELRRERLRPELRMADLDEDEQTVVERLYSAADPAQAKVESEAQVVVDRLMAELNPDERLVVKLLHLEERSTKEISRLTGWSISRVKVKAFRARAKMRKLCEGFAFAD